MRSVIFENVIENTKSQQKKRIRRYVLALLVCCALFALLVGVANYLSSLVYSVENYNDDGELGFSIEQSKEWSETMHGYVHGRSD